MANLSQFLTDSTGIAAPETAWNIFRNPDIDSQLHELNIKSPVFYKILEMLPDEEDAIQARYDWAEQDVPTNFTKINNGGGYSAVATSLNVDDGTIFLIGHVIRSMTHNELILITNIVGNTLTVTRGHAGSTAAILDDDEVLLDLGFQLGEADAAPGATGYVPTEKYNYCEMFSRKFNISELQNSTDVRYNVGKLARETLMKAFEIRRDMSYKLLYGKRNKGTNAASKTYYSTGGFYEFATSNSISVAAASLSWQSFYQTFEAAFVPTASSAKKILLCGAGVTQTVAKIAFDKTTFQEYNQTLGQVVNTITLPSGHQIEMIHDPYTFNTNYGTQNKGILIDTAAVNLKWMNGWRLQWKQNVQANDSHTRQDEIYGMCGLKLTLPDLHGSISLT